MNVCLQSFRNYIQKSCYVHCSVFCLYIYMYIYIKANMYTFIYELFPNQPMKNWPYTFKNLHDTLFKGYLILHN